MTANHRVYQDDSKYKLPKDAPEHERLERQAQSLVALMNDRPFHPRLVNPQKILDIGCGTGYMTHLLASLYPSARVIGVDIAPVPELQRERLSNIEYVQGDIRDLIGVDPRFGLESFDYVFQRFLLFGLTQWSEYIASVSRLLKPGGWLEAQEPSSQIRSSRRESIIDSTSWYRSFKPDAAAVGLDVEIGDHLLEIFSSTPTLQRMQEYQYNFNPGRREDTPEMFGITQQLPGLFEIVTKKICAGAGRRQEEVDLLAEEIRSRCERGFEEGVYLSVFAVIGQKAVASNREPK